MSGYQVKIPDYEVIYEDEPTPEAALSKAIHRLYNRAKNRTIYFRDEEFGYSKRKALIKRLEKNISNYVVRAIRVPMLVGLPFERAKERLKELELSLGEVKQKTFFPGVVIDQNPEFAHFVPINSEVDLVTDIKKANIVDDLRVLAFSLLK